jgi:hypothetical protein
MKLFPQSEQWVYTTLINPTTNEINHRRIDTINEFILNRTNKILNDWTFNEFVSLLNGILSANSDETEEIVLFKKEILDCSITGYTDVPYINNWDLCGLLLIVKKMKDENLTICEDPLDFIRSILILLRPILFLEDEDKYRFTYFPKNFTYTNVQNNEFMREFFSHNLFLLKECDIEEEESIISITDILSDVNYHASFLLLNDRFKRLCYEHVDSEQAYLLLPEELKNDLNFIKILLKNNGNALAFLSNEHTNNKELVLIAVKYALGGAIRFASEELQNNREFIIRCLESNKYVFRFLSPSFRSDKEIVTVAITSTGGKSLEYAAIELQNDEEFIISLVSINAKILKFVSENLQGNRPFLIEVVNNNGLALKYIDENLKANRNIVLAAVRNNGLALQFAPEELKSDEDIVYEAAYQNGKALKFASEELRNNREFLNRIHNI